MLTIGIRATLMCKADYRIGLAEIDDLQWGPKGPSSIKRFWLEGGPGMGSRWRTGARMAAGPCTGRAGSADQRAEIHALVVFSVPGYCERNWPSLSFSPCNAVWVSSPRLSRSAMRFMKSPTMFCRKLS